MAINISKLQGRFTNDPELRSTPDGVPVVNFVLAVPRPHYLCTDQQTADFITCIAWRDRATLIAANCKKGTLITIWGRLQSFSYVDKNGRKHCNQEVNITNIVFH